MSETGQGQGSTGDPKALLERLHEQGIINLDAPLRNILDLLESDEVSGYMMTEDTWALVVKDKYVLAG